jgi:hypothetical protein
VPARKPIRTAVDTLTGSIQAMVNPVALAVHVCRQLVVAVGAGYARTTVEAIIDAITLSIQVIRNAIAATRDVVANGTIRIRRQHRAGHDAAKEGRQYGQSLQFHWDNSCVLGH